MNILKHSLSVIAFLYLCYHIYTYGPGAFNITVMVIFLLSMVANYFKYRNESALKANEVARQERAERKHMKKHKKEFK